MAGAMQDLEQLRYPIGRFQLDAVVTEAKRAAWIEEIAALPANMRAAVAGLDDEQLDTQYRDAGWSVRQVAHHGADSHMNTYVRPKLALPESAAESKPDDERRS